MRSICQKYLHGFFKAAAQQIGEAFKGDLSLLGHARLLGQMEAINGVEKKERPHLFVQIVRLAAKAV